MYYVPGRYERGEWRGKTVEVGSSMKLLSTQGIVFHEWIECQLLSALTSKFGWIPIWQGFECSKVFRKGYRDKSVDRFVHIERFWQASSLTYGHHMPGTFIFIESNGFKASKINQAFRGRSGKAKLREGQILRKQLKRLVKGCNSVRLNWYVHWNRTRFVSSSRCCCNFFIHFHYYYYCILQLNFKEKKGAQRSKITASFLKTFADCETACHHASW